MSAIYDLDAANARTSYATTGKRFITDVVLGAANGIATVFAFTLSQVPIQKGSLIIACGTKASVTSGPHTKKRSAGVTTLPFISDDGQGNIVGPTVTSGTIDYETGICTITFSAAPGGGDDPTADFVQLIRTAGAGRCVSIKTVLGTDAGSVACKSVPAKIIRRADDSTGITKVFKFTISGWYKASAAIAAGIRIRVLFGATEDFAVGAASSSTDIIANGAATTVWQQFSQQITIPDGATARWMRLVAYHNADAVGGVSVFFDDFSVMMAERAVTDVELLPNPSFDFPGRITSNPASHYRDVLQGPANKQPLDDSRLDLATLQTWWTNNDMAGRQNNSILDQPSTIFDVLRNIAPLGRAAYQLRDGLYSVVQDIPQSTIVQHFTPRNSWGFKGTFAFPNLPQALRVRWTNPANNWQPDERIVYDDNPDGSGAYTAATLPVNPLFETLDVTNSVTDIDQAWREGRFHLAQGRLRPQVYELSCDIENLIAQRGDLIRVSHDVIAQGLGYARVKAVALDGSNNCTGVTLDESMLPMSFGAAYALRFRKSDNTSLLNSVTNTAAAIAPTLSSASSAVWATARVAIAGDRTQPTVRSSAVGPTGTAATAAVTMPAGSLAGELLFVHLKFNAAPGAIAAPAGWAQLLNISQGVESEAVFYKLSNGAEPGAYTFNWANSVAFASGSVCVTGNAGDAPIDAVAQQGFAAATTAAAPYPVAKTPAMDLILVFGAQNAAATLSLAGATTVYAPATSGFGCWSHAPAFVAGPTFTFATPIPAANPQPQVGDLAMFGLSGAETGQFLVTKIEPGADLSAIITFVDYAPAVYSADMTPPNQPSQTEAAPSVEAPVIASIQSDDVHVHKATGGRVVVSLTPPQSMLTNAGAIVSVEYQVRVSTSHALNPQGAYNGATTYNTGDMVTNGGQSWVSIVDSNVGVTPGSDGSKWTLTASGTPWNTPARVPFSEQVIIDNVEPKTIYDIQLRYIYKDGTVSAWSLEAAYTVSGQVTGPPDVASLTASEPSTGVVRLNWPTVKAKHIDIYEIRVGASWAAGTFVAQVKASDYKDHGVAPGTYTYWVGVLDTSGNYDANPQSVVIVVT